MTRKTTVQVTPENSERLEYIRKHLQRLYGDDMTKDDALGAALDAWDKVKAESDWKNEREFARLRAIAAQELT